MRQLAAFADTGGTVGCGIAFEPVEITSRAKAFAFAGEDNNPDAVIRRQQICGLFELVNQLTVQRVVLGRPVQRQARHAARVRFNSDGVECLAGH